MTKRCAESATENIKNTPNSTVQFVRLICPISQNIWDMIEKKTLLGVHSLLVHRLLLFANFKKLDLGYDLEFGI